MQFFVNEHVEKRTAGPFSTSATVVIVVIATAVTAAAMPHGAVSTVQPTANINKVWRGGWTTAIVSAPTGNAMFA